MRHTAHAAIFLRGLVKVEIGISVGFGGVFLQPHFFQQGLADHVGWASKRVAHTQVDVGLTEKNRVELTMKVSAMQYPHVAAFRYVIEIFWQNACSGIFATC